MYNKDTAKLQYRIIRKPEVLESFGISRTTLHNRINDGLIPNSICLGARAVGWLESEINKTLSAMIAGQNREEIQALVTSLEAQRKHALAVR